MSYATFDSLDENDIVNTFDRIQTIMKHGHYSCNEI